MAILDRRRFEPDRGNPVLPVLLGLIVWLNESAELLEREDASPETPLDDDALLVALGLLRIRYSLEDWLAEAAIDLRDFRDRNDAPLDSTARTLHR